MVWNRWCYVGNNYVKRVRMYCIVYCIDTVCFCFSTGLVSIQYPMDTVKFFSKPMLNCRFEEKTNGSWNWNLLKGNKTFDLNTGSSITVSFPNETSPNCTTVQIIKLSGNWAGESERPMMLANISRGCRILFHVYEVIVNIASHFVRCWNRPTDDNVYCFLSDD